MTHASIFIVTSIIVLVSVGCHGADGNADAFRLGTSMDATLKALERYEIPAKPHVGDYGAPHGRESRRYVVESSKSPDGLFLVWEKDVAAREFRIERIYLYHDWQNQGRLPKGKRQSETTVMDQVYLSDLKNWVETGEWAHK